MIKKLKINNKAITGFKYIAPWLIGFMIFQLYPLLSSFYYSFTNYTLLKIPKMIGFKNYIKIFTGDVYFWNSLKVTFIYILFSVPLKLIFSLFVAMILNMKLKLINLFRTIYYLPSILGGSVALSILWKFLFFKDGYINKIISLFGFPRTEFLGNPKFALGAIILLQIWQFGSSMVIFLAGLKQIPLELMEAAKIDGANKVQRFFSITIPFLTPMIFFNFIMQMIFAFQNFTSAYVVTRGGPANATRLFVLHIYEQGFTHLKMGYASSLSIVLFLILTMITLLIFKSSPYWTYYEDRENF